ncbi:MAG: rod shape-determining protein RodA [bacterium]
MWNRFKTFDPWLYLLPLILLAISVVFIYTLTVDSSGPGLYEHQAVFGVIGVVLMLAATFIDYRGLRSWANWIYLAGLIGLVLVRIPAIGKSDFGAQRWINLGFFQLQPAEIEKLVIIIVVAALLSRARMAVSGRRFAMVVGAILLPVVAIMLQPDLGTAIVVAFTGTVILLHARLRRWQLVTIITGLVLVITVVSLSFKEVAPFSKILKEYQKDRLASFIDPSRDPLKTGYNVQESVIAVGSGGVTGKGLGYGSQSELNFLPVVYADFIFAGIAEAWGLVGTWAILGIYFFLLYRVLQAARIAKDDFGMLICIGVLAKVLIEVLVNVGMNIRLMPVTGIPLPLLSYGGTTLFTNMLALGIVQSVVIRYKRLTF